MHKNMKYTPQTLSDSKNLPVLYEIEVAGANGRVRFLTGSFEIAVPTHVLLK